VHGNRAFADAPFLLSDCNDFRGQFSLLFWSLEFYRTIFEFQRNCRSVTTHWPFGLSVYAHKRTSDER
jgi:hypothetical protein